MARSTIGRLGVHPRCEKGLEISVCWNPPKGKVDIVVAFNTCANVKPVFVFEIHQTDNFVSLKPFGCAFMCKKAVKGENAIDPV